MNLRHWTGIFAFVVALLLLGIGSVLGAYRQR